MTTMQMILALHSALSNVRHCMSPDTPALRAEYAQTVAQIESVITALEDAFFLPALTPATQEAHHAIA